MYVILGATGHTGSTVANKLLQNGKKIRVFGRDAKKLASFANRGAEIAVGDISDSMALTKAFDGAEAVYTMIPPSTTSTDYRAQQNQQSDAIAKALDASGVQRVVVLSSFGADKKDKTGPIAGLHYLESRLADNKSLNVVFVRAGYFMENLLAQAAIIQNFGMMAGPVNADLKLPMIATRDIGEFAATTLLKLDFTGQQACELLGQRDATYSEVAKIIGAAIGKPGLAYVQLPNDQIIEAMVSMGVSRNMAGLICEMSDALNSGHVKALESRSVRNSTSTSLETFVKEEFLPAFSGGKAANA